MFDSRAWFSGLSTIAAICLSAQVGWAVTMTLTSATVQDSAEPARLCVGLVLDARELVAGTANDLVWDGACVTLRDETCAANPAHGKDLSGAVQSQVDFTYKALVLSLSDVDPIPAGDLYCCDFSVHVAAPGDCCEVRVENSEASDPTGNSLVTSSGMPGRVCLSSDNATPLPTSTTIATSTPSPTVSPQPSGTTVPFRRTSTPAAAEDRTRRPTAVRLESDDGCAIGASDSSSWLPWLPALALLALRKRRVSK